MGRSSSRFRTMAYSHGAHNEDTLQRENVSDSSDQSLSQGKDEGAVYRENVVESNETDLAPAHDGFQKEVLETADPHFTVSKEREQKLIRKLDIRILPMIMWIATFTAFVQNLGGLLACRLLLGIFEAGFFPGVIIYLTIFYNKRELALRTGYFFSAAAISSAVGGLVAYGIGEGMDGTAGWR